MAEEKDKKHREDDIKFNLGEKIFSIILVLLVIYIIDWGFLKKEITNYKVVCPDDFDGCYTLRYSRYKININKQEVIHWVEGFPPDTIDDCSIINRKNWRCKWSDGSAEFGFTSGDYFNYSLTDNATDMFNSTKRTVTRFNYLLHQWGLR